MSTHSFLNKEKTLDSEESDRKSRRTIQKKNQILEAAAQLFAEKGFHRTTTKDIALAADVSEGTLYNYFDNKEDLLFGIMEKLVDNQQLGRQLSLAELDDAQDFLVAMLNERRDYVQSNHDMLQSVLSEILVDPDLRHKYYHELVLPGIDTLEQHLTHRQRSGQIKKLDERLLSRFLVSIFLGMFLLDVIHDPLIETHWEQYVRVVADTIFNGIAF
jgi:TetR/AcrR family fatty acid metabolism transcriptional regulator